FYHSASAQDARWFAAWSLGTKSRTGLRHFSVIEGDTGKEIFSDEARADRGGVSHFDPSGTLLACRHAHTLPATDVIELPSAKLVYTGPCIEAMAPRAAQFVIAEAQPNAVPVSQRGGEAPFVKLKLNFPEGPSCFSPNGRTLALGNSDGT